MSQLTGQLCLLSSRYSVLIFECRLPVYLTHPDHYFNQSEKRVYVQIVSSHADFSVMYLHFVRLMGQPFTQSNLNVAEMMT